MSFVSPAAAPASIDGRIYEMPNFLPVPKPVPSLSYTKLCMEFQAVGWIEVLLLI